MILLQDILESRREMMRQSRIIPDHPAECVHVLWLMIFPCRLVLNLNRAFFINSLLSVKNNIDPGPWGQRLQAGAVTLEKDVVIPIANNLERNLKKAGWSVLTRRTDKMSH